MSVIIVVGSQWGDEAKAKIVDYLADDADYVVRFQGGANAGHTVVVDGNEFIFHLFSFLSGIMSIIPFLCLYSVVVARPDGS